MKVAVRLVAIAVMASLALPVRASRGPFPPVTVSILEVDGVARSKWPLSFGFPLPRGALRDATAIGISDARGLALPVQARVLTRWTDGSVRWVLLDTEVTIAAHQRAQLRVLPGKSAPVVHPLQLTERPDRFEVDTHAVRFQTPKHGAAIVDKLGPDAKAATGPVWTTMVAAGKRSTAAPARQARIAEAGPLRTRIELEGEYGNGFDYLIRVDAYAGQPFLRILHTLINRNAEPYVDMSQLTLDIPLTGLGAASYAIGVEGKEPRTGPLLKDDVRVVQPDNLTYVLDGATREGRLAGWVDMIGGVGNVGVAARWLWREYPKGFALRSDHVTYNLWDPAAAPAKTGMGAAKTHEVVIWAAAKGAFPQEQAAAAGRPLVAAVDPAWLARTRALPQAIAPNSQTQRFVDNVVAAFGRYRDRTDSERWDDSGRAKCPPSAAQTPRPRPAEDETDAAIARVDPTPGPNDRPRTGAYGMWNWGDWNFPGYHDDTKGCDSWGNEEYDTPQVLALAFAATGDPSTYEYLIAAARHFMDVDRIYFDRKHPDWAGMNHPKNPLHFSFEFGGVDLGHTWTEGLLSYFYLTGDARGLEAARGIADYLLLRIRSPFLRGNPRQWGWPQIALLALYDATGDEKYRSAALQYAQRGMRAFAPDQIHDWKVGLLADALAYTHAATGDADTNTWLRAYAKHVIEAAPRDARFYPAVAYVARLTGDAQLRAAALARADQLDLGAWGKPFTIQGRIGFRIHSLLDSTALARPAR